jgi:Rps23 Pro-64 3,4-dihydroxylase Tpa1-like proline 4-hydroxylase
MKELKDYIVVMENIMPPPIINAVLSEYKNSDDWIPATAGYDGQIRENIRACSNIGMSFDYVINKNEQIRKDIDTKIYAIAFQAINQYAQKFNQKNIIIAEQDSGYELLKYETNQFYTQHIDSFKERPRAVSCSFMLNDDYEGGEFAFFNREIVYKLKKGSCIMFPSNFMYPHEIMPVTSGTRYSIITWFV